MINSYSQASRAHRSRQQRDHLVSVLHFPNYYVWLFISQRFDLKKENMLSGEKLSVKIVTKVHIT